MKTLLAQLAPRDRVDANSELVRETILTNRDADIAVFPELFLNGYRPMDAANNASGLYDLELKEIGQICSETDTAAIVGFTERLADSNKVANAAACFDRDGEMVAVYRKIQLFRTAEQRSFVPGDSFHVIDLGIGVAVGPLICFDIEFPEPARALALAGAQLLISSSANMEPYYFDHELAGRARALENRLPHIYVNRVGCESGFNFVGGSRVIDRDGHVLVSLDDRETAVVVEINIDLERPGAEVDYLQQVRCDVPVQRQHGPQGGEK